MAEAILRHALTAPAAAACPDVDSWWAGHRAAAARFAISIDRAIAGGCAADRPAWAFASGYQEALRRLLPELGEARAALCATEAGGAHPRAIETRLDGDRLTGAKQFVTLGSRADQLLIIASVGRGADRNQLALVRIPAGRAGVRLDELPAAPFVPE